MLIHGSCHCGNIAFVLHWKPEPAEIVARVCTCSFCVKNGSAWATCPDGSLRLNVDAPSLVSWYAFGTRTADFHVCVRCGIVPVATSRIDGHLYAVVNVNTFRDADSVPLRREPMAFDGEDEAGRLERRKRHWIANVEYST